MDTSDKIGATAIGLIFIGFGFILGVRTGKYDKEREAVKAGVAQWVIVQNENGSAEKEFKWIVPIEKKEK